MTGLQSDWLPQHVRPASKEGVSGSSVHRKEDRLTQEPQAELHAFLPG